MVGFVLTVLIWVGVAVALFIRRELYYIKNPYAWSRRHEGLISLSDRERYWWTWFWPVVLVVGVFFGAIAWVILMIEERFGK